MTPAPENQRDIELGWVIWGRLDPADREAVRAARANLRETLSGWFPEYRWRMPLLERSDVAQEVHEEPAALLDTGVGERDERGWDFVFIVTGADLHAHYERAAMAAPSRAMGVAVISTLRIDPLARGDEAEEAERVAIMTRRIEALGLHLFGRLNGLGHDGEAGSAMRPVHRVEELERVTGYTPADRAELGRALAEVADLRLEEESRHQGLRFYLAAAWVNRRNIASAIRRSQPWQLPLRLSKLTTAALSALVVLLNTAETWELSLSQSPGRVAAVSVLALIGTVWYVVKRQKLLLHRHRHPLTEQTVTTNLAAVSAVGIGLVTTYLALFALSLGVGLALFPASLAGSWAPTAEGIGRGDYALVAGMIATLGMIIGAMGASFEQQYYFRHIAYVDEEI